MNKPDPADSLAAQLDKLRRQYIDSLPGRAAGLAECWERYSLTGEPSAARELQQLAHQLSGSAGSYGLPALGQLARAVEDELERELGAAPGGPGDAPVARLVGALIKALRRTGESEPPASQ